jgi:squalene-hopene/tetraprenyl-beta-curcumene cyclase
MRTTTTVFSLILAVLALSGGLRSQEQQPSRWDPAGAAQYLDARMEEWFAKATKVRTGDGTASCVSCHTPVPYALARPALRRAMGQASPTALETRLVDEVTRRVETYGSHELANAFDDEKKKESRGTEAVLNALVLANRDARDRSHRLSDATRIAFDHLWEVQRRDGTWDWLQFGLEPFESVNSWYYGATLAALAITRAPALPTDTATAKGVERLRDYLKTNYRAQNLFNRAWLLLAWDQATVPSAEREYLVNEIRQRQRADGGWSLQLLGPWKWARANEPFSPPGTLDTSLVEQSDGYATGLIVYALRQVGLGAGDPTVAKGLRWLSTNQREIQVGDQIWKAWRAYSLNFDREHSGAKGETWRRLFMSDSATAFAVLALSPSS